MSIFGKKNTSELIVDYVLDLIQKRELKKGDKLMTEREFSEKLGVSRVPLREALCALSIIGILETQQGGGTYISTNRPEILGNVFYAYAILDETPLHEIVVARRSLESDAAELAARNATTEDLEEIMRALLVHQEAMQKDPKVSGYFEEVEKADYAFHKSIAAATHNSFLCRLIQTTTVSFHELHMQSSKNQVTIEHLQRMVNNHVRIAEAIKAGDPAGARLEMYTHLDDIYNNVLEDE